MLNQDALSQLKSLKKTIVESKDRAEGIVKGTQQRFGFVVLNDGREIFLAQDEMQKVFPGDHIKVEVVTDEKDKPTAIIEKLIRSDIKEFCGSYVVKGKGHFVEPDLPRFNRWIFIPPNARNGAKDGDYVRCRINRHAFPHGKPQANVLTVIGNDTQPGIEADYVINKFALDQPWPADWPDQTQDSDNLERADLTGLPLVTIDAPSSRDLDDAVFARTDGDGWELIVAVADPTAVINTGSALEKEIARRASSSYLPGAMLPMLPSELTERCSLLPSQIRPAMVCQLRIAADGQITGYEMLAATISSKAKLSYQDVADVISKTSEHPFREQLQTLHAVSMALLGQRQREHLLIDNRPEFRLVLNASRKIECFDIMEKTVAHTLIEECMVAANRCAADFMGESGLFSTHAGFRPERLPDVHKLASEQLGMADVAPETLPGYRAVMHTAATSDNDFPVRSVLSRLLERARLSTTATPHFGMALSAYSTFTSPLRKYADFLVHRLIKQRLRGESTTPPDNSLLENMQQSLDNIRQARMQMEQWLKCQYLEGQVGNQFDGVVVQVNSNGFTVRLNENGVEGFIEARSLPEKVSFDPMRMRLSNKNGLCIQLDQPAQIKVESVDSRHRNIRFTLISKLDEAQI